MTETIAARADKLMAAADLAITTDIAAIQARAAADGLLQSGSTIKNIIAAIDTRYRDAVAQSLDAVSKRVSHRGRAWKSGIRDVRSVLDSHIAIADSQINWPMYGAGEAAVAAAKGLISEMGNRLREQVTAYDEGWTSPRFVPWSERHPISYALIFLVIGALAPEVIKVIGHLLSIQYPDFANTVN